MNVFAWMLWGDLCLTISESVVPRLVPMQMQSLGASNAAIGIVTGSIYSLMNWVMNPIISTKSDRHRGPLGRRMPFMLYTAPPIALFLTAFGFAREIGSFVHLHLPMMGAFIIFLASRLLPGVGALSQGARLTIAMLAVLMVLFRFFDLFPQCVYYYAFGDVIPQPIMGTFVCLFRVTSTLGTIMFHEWLLPYADTHPEAIYAGSAALYFCTFTMLPLLVKEGTYPPPPPRVQGSWLPKIKEWVREVFTLSFYWKYFLTYASYRWAFVPFNLFLIVYAEKMLGLNATGFGHLMGIVLVVQIPALFLLGPIVDRFHPTRVAICAFALMALSGMAGFFLIHNRATFIGCTIAAFGSAAIVLGCLSTLGLRLLYRPQYGQFSAANAMVSESGMLFFSYACGAVLDRLGQRYLFAWMAAFGAFGLMMVISLYRAWLARGGDADYTPPFVVPRASA
jgi:maltose/moltooligosaccharide transporter